MRVPNSPWYFLNHYTSHKDNEMTALTYTLDRGGYEALEASDRVLEIDTTDFARIDYRSLFELVGDRLLEPNS
jgi:hypothetical protein